MSDARSPFLRHLLRNLRITVIICAVGIVGVLLYALASGEDIAWNIPAFLAIGMILSSVLNAWLDARREARSQ
jgi:hypothetical protein